MAQNIIRKYVWLIETIRQAHEITFRELNRRWLDEEMSSNADPDKRNLELRTFHKWREAIADIFGVIIACKRVGGYHYYIENLDDFKYGDMRSWIIDTMATSEIFIEHKSLKRRVMLEEVPSSRRHLAVLLQAMKVNRPITIEYQGFEHEHGYTFDVHPYAVRLFKQRWYLVAYSPWLEQVRIYALDRINAVAPHESGTFKMPDDFDVADYFRDYYGVVRYRCEPQLVRLRVTADQVSYLRSLPLHASQDEVDTQNEFSVFAYWLSPEYDFRQALLAMGDSVAVLQPRWLKDEIADIARSMAAIPGKDT